MPIVITPDIIAATQQPEAGWTLMQLTFYKLRENKDKSGVDYVFTFECLAGPGSSNVNKGRRIVHVVYSKALQSQVSDECRKLVELLSALSGVPATQLVGEEIDPSDFIGRQVWGEIKDEPYEGRILKRINAFSPDDVVPF